MAEPHFEGFSISFEDIVRTRLQNIYDNLEKGDPIPELKALLKDIRQNQQDDPLMSGIGDNLERMLTSKRELDRGADSLRQLLGSLIQRLD